jgi:hypothetical protein
MQVKHTDAVATQLVQVVAPANLQEGKDRYVDTSVMSVCFLILVLMILNFDQLVCISISTSH